MFLDLSKQYKHWNTGLISTGFEFDINRLRGMEGFPVMAAKIAEANSFKSWAHDNVGQAQFRTSASACPLRARKSTNCRYFRQL